MTAGLRAAHLIGVGEDPRATARRGSKDTNRGQQLTRR